MAGSIKPVRVLHVLGVMNPGGVETWLLQLMRHRDRRRLEMDFLVHTDRPGVFDADIQRLGGRVLPCPLTSGMKQYAVQFLSMLRRLGPFDAVHSHVHHFSGFVLSLARAARIPNRISHSHTVRSGEGVSAFRKTYLNLSRRLIAAVCTHGLAASAMAASELYGDRWCADGRFEVLPCGVDLDPFRIVPDRKSVRAEFGFGAGDLVFGHVGRFDQYKNQGFLVDIASQIAIRRPDARFLLVGDGPLREAVEQGVRAAGIAGRTVFTGNRPDVPRLMLGAMDRFLFPSKREGLGLALVEAQAAGLPAVISEVIPPEADIVPSLITRLSLDEPAEIWAERAIGAGTVPRTAALAQIEASPFNLAASMRRLANVYGI